MHDGRDPKARIPMLKIGVTGGIGTGKSTVCRIFESLGIPVFYADQEAQKLLENDDAIHAGIKLIFGEAAFTGGAPDRKKIADIVFNNRSMLEKLNALLHPATIARSEEWFMKQAKVPYAIKEAALIYEAGVDKQLHKVVVVVAPKDVCVSRIMVRDGITADDVEARMRNQMSMDEKVSRADFLIVNDEVKPLIPQVQEIHAALLSIA